MRPAAGPLECSGPSNYITNPQHAQNPRYFGTLTWHGFWSTIFQVRGVVSLVGCMGRTFRGGDTSQDVPTPLVSWLLTRL
jgi:hypothetical protein